MSVFTHVSLDEISGWLQCYEIGQAVEIEGISAGITNTNYFVHTQIEVATPQANVGRNRYVLTLFEHHTIEELPFFIALMGHLAKHGIPCPAPIHDKHGESLHMLNGKPAALVSCLSGRDTETPSMQQCAEVGRVLAQMHLAGQSFTYAPSVNQRGEAWRLETAKKVLPYLEADDQLLLKETLAFQAGFSLNDLPRGVIHADLFRDNVLFDGEKIGGLIDFYYACHDVLAYDLAIAVNDWCVQADGTFDRVRLHAMLTAYKLVRQFTLEEEQAWHGLLRIAALRFWLSRLYDKIFPQSGELTHAKDPEHFKRILLLRSKAL